MGLAESGRGRDEGVTGLSGAVRHPTVVIALMFAVAITVLSLVEG